MKNKLHVEVPETPELFKFRLFRPEVEMLIAGLNSLYLNEIHGKMISGENLSGEEESKLQQLEEDVMSLKKFLKESIDKQTTRCKRGNVGRMPVVRVSDLLPENRAIFLESLKKNYYDTMIGLLRGTMSWEEEGAKARRLSELINEFELPF